MRTRAAGAMLAALLLLGAPALARAESTLWSLTVSPTSVSTGSTTTFALTATNEDPLAPLQSDREIGCVIVDVPTNFSVISVAISEGDGDGDGGDSWVASMSGNRVRVQATDGGDRLDFLDSVSFTVRATALSAGSQDWNANAYLDQNCTGSGALVGVAPIVLVTGVAATPTPTPTPIPTPTPTPTPLLPLPTASLPLPVPSLDILPTPTPTPSPTPRSTVRPTPTPTPSEDPELVGSESAGTTTGGTRSPGSPSSSAPAALPRTPGTPAVPEAGGRTTFEQPRLTFEDPALGFELGRLDLLEGVEVWVVPAATIAGPGLVLLLLVLLQAGGALAWIPAVRRLRGEDAPTPT